MVIKNIGKEVKRIAKKSQSILNLYSWYSFFRTIRIKDFRDFLDIPKMKIIFTIRPYTMLGYPRLSNLYHIASYLQRKKINGSFVECGVWNGGSAGAIAAVSKNDGNRHIWLFDSWEGLPEPGKSDISYNGKMGQKGMAIGFEEKVMELIFKKLRLDNKKIHLIKGWFNDTLPTYKKDIGDIALLHLDCDWYESIRFCLEELYENVIQGGFIVIDDYGCWMGCKKAVNEFIKQRRLNIELIKVDYSEIYFQKK